MRRMAIVAGVLMIFGTTAPADELVVFGAGSLRASIGQIASEFSQAHGVKVTTQFGPSGRMRERIEKGSGSIYSPLPMSDTPASWWTKGGRA